MKPTNDPTAPESLIVDRDVLAEPFRAAETPRERWRIGGEAEKFGVDLKTGAPVQYDGDRGVVRIFDALTKAHDWQPVREADGGPVIALTRGQASVTLEPGAQLELSGEPVAAVHGICAELRNHLAELSEISNVMNVGWLGVGFHPLATQNELPWVPKQRYRIMREYLPTKGPRALDMMRRTATVQANFDYESEQDALRKLVVSLKLSPLIAAMTANAPFYEGRLAHKKSVRAEVWLAMDPERSGLIPSLWKASQPGYADYVEWALDAGMFLFKRDGRVIENTGQPFRSFLEAGYEGHRATFGDWTLHLNTLFPEARLKNTLEVRCCDSLPTNMACAPPAIFTGVLYDDAALAAAVELTRHFDYEQVQRARPDLVKRGLGAPVAGKPARELAMEVLDIACGGLERRARLTPGGRDERVHLEKLKRLVEAGRCPADELTDGLSDDTPELRQKILSRSGV